MSFNHEAEALFIAECARRVALASAIWARFGSERGLVYAVDPTTGLPTLLGRRDAVDVAVAGFGDPRVGYRTRASASVAIPLEGRVRVGVPGMIESLLGELLGRTFFRERGAPELDDRLVVSARPTELARTILDETVVTALRPLAHQRIDDFTYDRGTVAVVWAGIEPDTNVLDGVLDLLVKVARLAQGAHAYR